jgi:DNA primase
VSEDVLRRLQGGLAPADEKSKMSGRYCFPVRNRAGQIVGWTGRLVSEASFGPNWKHLCRVSRCIYPYHAAIEPIKATRKVVLYESLGDFLACATHGGIWNGLVLLGLNLNSPTMGLLLSVNPTHIIISTNNDGAAGSGKDHTVGNKAADKIRGKLVRFFSEDKIRIMLPPKKDWGECSPEEIAAFAAEVNAL